MEHEFPFGTFHPKTQGALSSQQNFRIEFSKFYVEVMSHFSLTFHPNFNNVIMVLCILNRTDICFSIDKVKLIS